MIYYWFKIECKKILYKVKSTPTMSKQKQNAKLFEKNIFDRQLIFIFIAYSFNMHIRITHLLATFSHLA